VFVYAIAVVLADVIVTIESIALVALCADGLRANRRRIAAVYMMRNGGLARLVMLKMHTEVLQGFARRLYRMLRSQARKFQAKIRAREVR
jgi:hypothetical protein